MTRPPLDLADLHHLPWSPAPRPGDELPPPTPDNPTPGRPGPCHAPAKACGCGVLNGEDCDCADIAAQLEQAARAPIFFDFRRAAA